MLRYVLGPQRVRLSISGWRSRSAGRLLWTGHPVRHACRVTSLRALHRLDADWPWVLDSVLAAALLLVSLLAVHSQSSPSALHVALVVLGSLPYTFRRRSPLIALVIAGSIVVGMILLGLGTPVLGSGLFLLAYTVAAGRGWRPALAGAAFCLVLLGIVAVSPRRMSWAEVATNLALFVGSFALGRAARSHREAAAAQADRAALAEHARTEATRTAASEEKLRIARELHDVVGHSLGVIALQAGVGARIAQSDPEEARLALLAIADRSRASLHEVRQILGALRTGDDEVPATAGMEDIPDLVERISAAGVAVDLCSHGAPWPVSGAFGLTTYRLLQESLTNVVRHSGATHAAVTLDWDPDRLTLTVTDDGRGATEPEALGGGLLGMQERVAIWDGSLRTGNAPGRGYTVQAILPRPQEDA